MKRIVYLTFYFKPDLCAGSFRNSPLALELAQQAKTKDIIVEVYTTLPNRYSSFDIEAPVYEELDNLKIYRISLPPHKSGMVDQIFSFLKFYSEVFKLNKGKKADLVFASSSRLFTAFIGYRLALKSKSLLYLDIRDIFVDTMNDVLKSRLIKKIVLPALEIIERKTFKNAQHINLISGGFDDYFKKNKKAIFSYFSNGIDEEFLDTHSLTKVNDLKGKKKQIVYAGNIGEGQGLHKIIPQAAKLLGSDFEFLIIGDGGTKNLLEEEIKNLGIYNVILQDPMKRTRLIEAYNNADFLFIHLNDYIAFRKVLPSKIFELATFSKPIIAGVGGFAAKFIKDEVTDSFVFEPCNIVQLVDYLRFYKLSDTKDRIAFKEKYRRSYINKEMATSILNYL